jgi:hypothetical protein
MVLLIGNYPVDRQQSMQRFATMMLQGLVAAGIPVEIAAPAPVFGRLFGIGNFLGKWLAYIDKFVLFPRELRMRLRQRAAVVHICDHSNAMYAGYAGKTPVVVTCHDLIAVRSALGEELHCPVSFTGRLLQHWILRSLRHADAVICVSNATRDDADRLVSRNQPSPKLETINNGLNYPYRKLLEAEALARLKKIETAFSEFSPAPKTSGTRALFSRATFWIPSRCRSPSTSKFATASCKSKTPPTTSSKRSTIAQLRCCFRRFPKDSVGRSSKPRRVDVRLFAVIWRRCRKLPGRPVFSTM